MLPRTTILAPALLLIVHVVVVFAFGDARPGPFLSNAVQLGVGSFCVIGAFQAARLGSAFERRFLQLVGARYLIWALAQGLATYYQLAGDVQFSGSLADVVFHLEDVPLAIALFLHPREESDRLGRAHAVDLAQMLVFWSALGLYVRHLTTSTGPGLVAATDALVAGCFYFRAVTSRSSVAGTMFGRWVPAILLSTVNDAYSGFYNSQPGGHFDLVWSLEMMVWIVTVTSWRPVRGEGARASIDRTIHLLPRVVACFTLVVAFGLAQERPLLAALVAALAVIIAAARPLARRLREG
jgi:hypothetical protein